MNNSKSSLRLLWAQSISCFGIGRCPEWDLVVDNDKFSIIRLVFKKRLDICICVC